MPGRLKYKWLLLLPFKFMIYTVQTFCHKNFNLLFKVCNIELIAICISENSFAHSYGAMFLLWGVCWTMLDKVRESKNYGAKYCSRSTFLLNRVVDFSAVNYKIMSVCKSFCECTLVKFKWFTHFSDLCTRNSYVAHSI